MRCPAAFPAVALLVAACSDSGSVSTPVLSGLTFTGTALPGGTESGTFAVENAAGVTSLSLELTLTDPAGVKAVAPVEPLAVTGAAQSTASATINVEVPADAPTGLYTVTLTVSDGTDTSAPLTGTFEVD